MATSSSNDPSTYSAGTTPTGSEQVLANQSGSLVSLTTAQLTQLSYNSLALWKTYDTVAQMKAGASAAYPRVKWRGYNYVGDGGGGEGIYVVSASGVTYTADEGSIFATTAGGYVLRDIPAGDVKTTWFGMTAVSGMANTTLNPTTTAANNDAGYNPNTDMSTALQNASNFAAAAGRALHIVGRQGSYLLRSGVTFTNVRHIYGDGATLDARFGTSLMWSPTTIVDLAAGVTLPDEGQIFEKISVTMNDANWPASITPSTLISGGQITLPSGFVWHTDVLPYSAFSPGIVGIAVNNKCVLRDVSTLHGKFGATINGVTGHVAFENCSLSSGLAGRFWVQNGQDYLISEGGAAGNFCCELMTEYAFAGTVSRYHQYHCPIGWYQCNYRNTGVYNGMYLDGRQLSIEMLSESWIYQSPKALGSSINVISGGDFYGNNKSTVAAEYLPAALFANSTRQMYASGRFGGLAYFNLNGFAINEIVSVGGAGTYAAAFSGFPQNMAGSDFSMFNFSNVFVDTIVSQTYDPYTANVAWKRNVLTPADRSDVAMKTQAPRIGNMLPGTNAYSASLGLGVANNCILGSGGGWTVYNGNSSYPGSPKLNTYSNWLAAGVALVIPAEISRMVGPNPYIIEMSNTGGNTSLIMPLTQNNVADGQQQLSSMVFIAGYGGVIVTSSVKREYTNSLNNPSLLTFRSITMTGKVLAAGTTVTQFGIDCNVLNAKTYIMCPMLNFGALSEFNSQVHPSVQAPMYLSSGLRQAGRAFATTTASGGATTAVTIADFLVEVNATAAAATVTLPAAPFDGEVHVIKKADTSANAVTVSGNGLLIDGASTYVLSGSARGSVRLQYVGSAATPHWCVM